MMRNDHTETRWGVRSSDLPCYAFLLYHILLTATLLMMAIPTGLSGKNLGQESLQAAAWLRSVLLAVPWPPAIGLWVAQFLWFWEKCDVVTLPVQAGSEASGKGRRKESWRHRGSGGWPNYRPCNSMSLRPFEFCPVLWAKESRPSIWPQYFKLVSLLF